MVDVMAQTPIIYRAPKNDSDLLHAMEAVKQATEVLNRCPPPDTFIGRKTQEPFPMRDEEQGRFSWLVP